ncbi:protein of unknown function DUF302 [Thermodesulfobacterium geofontis OPF15]|jgi:uncharacterized protein (DUF302 family)|uniref:DUF302 domain-containing protein n=1 Tax=Thermodesulfobacterium geofontis (strain OPF15) TaxID=795359 RepID=F8C5L8_THEGP|nr:protein of unknown function DUF302 [Thermodesulfobacterium geofontis OPF15]
MRKDLLKNVFITIFSMTIISCGGVIKDISFETGDYLGTGYDEKEAIPEPSEEEEMSDVYEKATRWSYEELDKFLRTELEKKNFKIFHILKLLEEQENKDLWGNICIYLIYKTPQYAKIIKHNPQLISQFPFKIYVYEKNGRIIVGTFKPSTAIRYMGNLDTESIKALKELDLELKEIIDKIAK